LWQTGFHFGLMRVAKEIQFGLAAACAVCCAASGLADEKVEREERGWRALQNLIEWTNEPPEVRRGDIREVLASLKNVQEPPLRPSYDFFEIPIAFAARLRNGIGRGTTEAANLPKGTSEDTSLADPPSSSFWTRRKIPELDLYHGFGRVRAEDFGSRIWNYSGPKLGFGMNPGFKAKGGGLKIRVKFAEIKSEPFSARIFWALGYNVDATDHSKGLKVRYDRRLFQEFNLGGRLSTQFRFAHFIPLYTLKLQKRYDPFNYIAWAVMNDGRRISGSNLKRELLVHTRLANDDAFRTEVEEQIDYLVTIPANVQIRDKTAKSIGPWDFDALGHEDRRELRGAGLLAAWIGWYDCRKQNTRLKVVQQSGQTKVVHYFSDLGGGLGKSHGIFSGDGERPNEFGWTFTKGPIVAGGDAGVPKAGALGDGSRGRSPHRMALPFRITGYRPMEHNEAFERMTVGDARWMARLIAQLTEKQIVEALATSGFDSGEVRLYTEKLISRRDQMIRDLGLAREIGLLRGLGINRRFNYDPKREGGVVINLKSDVEIQVAQETADVNGRVSRN
jgi:hypothetical protein